MTNNTPGNTPGDPQGYFDQMCFPGKSVTVFVKRCDTGESILSFTIATDITDAHAYNNGTNYALVCATVGLTVTVSATGYTPKKHQFTQAEIDARQVVVCLDLPPPPAHKPKIISINCAVVSSVVGSPTLSAVDDLRTLRTVLALNSIGRELLNDYQDSELQERAKEAIAADPELRALTLNLVLIGSDVLRRFSARSTLDYPIPLGAVDDCRGPIITEEFNTAVQRWGRLLVERGGDALAPPVARFQGLVSSVTNMSRSDTVAVLLEAEVDT